MLSIKGTDSLPDVVRDVCALPLRLGKYWVHEGMASSAEWFCSTLGPIIAKKCAETGYQPIVTGHSLGAGVACLTTHLMHEGLLPW